MYGRKAGLETVSGWSKRIPWLCGEEPETKTKGQNMRLNVTYENTTVKVYRIPKKKTDPRVNIPAV